MPALLIRNLEEEIVVRLKWRAKANGRSLEGEFRVLLSDAATDPLEVKRADFTTFAEEFQAQLEGDEHTPSELLVRESRESDHRV